MQTATSQTAVEVEETKLKPRKLDEKRCGWSDLPVEIMAIILRRNGKIDVIVTLIACRFVCRQWRDLLPFPKDWPFFPNGSKFDYAARAAEA